MLRNRGLRRFVAIFLVVLGGALMYLAPAGWVGMVLLILGVVVEVAGITLERKVK